jgi:DtxR family Mn-dependent transcriptional regulator
MASAFSISRFDEVRPLSSLNAGDSGVVTKVVRDSEARADRLAALGVTPGARIRVLQTFPGIVFQCDETELAVERGVARSVLVNTSTDAFGPTQPSSLERS